MDRIAMAKARCKLASGRNLKVAAAADMVLHN